MLIADLICAEGNTQTMRVIAVQQVNPDKSQQKKYLYSNLINTQKIQFIFCLSTPPTFFSVSYELMFPLLFDVFYVFI